MTRRRPVLLALAVMATPVLVNQTEAQMAEDTAVIENGASMAQTEAAAQLDGEEANGGLTEPADFPDGADTERLVDPTISDASARTTAEADAVMAPMSTPYTGALIRAESVEGARIYSIADAYDQTFWDSGEPFGPVAAEWSKIGHVEDLLIDNVGMVVGVSVDVGGFLGIGERTVLLSIDDLRLIQMPDDDEFYFVTRTSGDALHERDEVTNVVGRD